MPATIARPAPSWSSSSTTGPTTTWRCTTRACPSTPWSSRRSRGGTSGRSCHTTTRTTAGRKARGTYSRVFASRERRMVAEPTYLTPGVVLQDRYEIADEIGRGGFSIVYRARDRRVGADVAIKLLVPPPAAARLARARLRREVQAVRQLSHPNIVAVYDVVDDGPWSFVVMEYVAGPDLAVRVRQRGPLDPDAAARLGREVSEALAAAHGRGILHRDVKPQNILLAPDGRARLTDFGSARLAGQETATHTGGRVGPGGASAAGEPAPGPRGAPGGE